MCSSSATADAQSIEQKQGHQIRNQQVRGSTPRVGSLFSLTYKHTRKGNHDGGSVRGSANRDGRVTGTQGSRMGGVVVGIEVEDSQ